jgi:hypothetical protein
MAFQFTAIKDPDAQLDYALDWSLWLNVADTIAASTWIVPTNLIVVASTFSSTSTTVWLKGGIAGETYVVTNRITTASNPTRIEDRSIQITMAQR